MILNNLRQQISDVINNAHLSIDAVYFVMKDIFNEIEKLYYTELQREQEAQEKEQQEPDEK